MFEQFEQRLNRGLKKMMNVFKHAHRNEVRASGDVSVDVGTNQNLKVPWSRVPWSRRPESGKQLPNTERIRQHFLCDLSPFRAKAVNQQQLMPSVQAFNH